MPEVTFTPEQVREIRRRIEAALCYPADGCQRTSVLKRFPLPKVTRYRTFVRGVDTYRVNGSVVEFRNGDEWVASIYGGTAEAFAAEMARLKDWTTLAAFADVCARPTEEVDA